MSNKVNLKAIVLSLGLAVMTLVANNLNAQDRGLFGRGAMPETYTDNGTMNRGEATINSGTSTGITNDDFGTPLGSGIVILLGAGLGYVALKKKEDEQ